MVEEFEAVGSFWMVKFSQGHIMPHWWNDNGYYGWSLPHAE